MSVRALKVAGAALIAAAMFAPTAVGAQQYRDNLRPQYASERDNDRGRDRAGYPRVSDRDPPLGIRRADYRERRPERCEDDSVGTILGAIAGGLLGNGGDDRHGNRPRRAPGGGRDCS